MDPAQATQQLICGAAMMVFVFVFLIGGFKLLHGPDYRKDKPPDGDK